MYIVSAQKLVHELLSIQNLNKGLILKLKEENVPEEIITRIIADFIIAAGDTVRTIYKCI